jgi:cytochrome c biogenesis protein CcmG, thiol:disulfide interchange protein DsbE
MAEPASGTPPPQTGGDLPAGKHPLFRLLQLLALAGVAGLLALLVWRMIDSGRGAQLVSAIREGKKPPAPQFTLPVIWPHSETWPKDTRRLVTEGRVPLRGLRGHPTVINFWASWCAPCGKEAPRFRASARAHEGQVVFLGIDVNDFKSDARHFLRKYKVNFPSVRDGGGSTLESYGLTGLPESYFVDARGRVVAHSPGEVSRAELERGVAQAMGRGS